VKNDMEAIKLIQDWSKWLVGINTAGIGAIGALTIKGSNFNFHYSVFFALFSVLSFLLSLLSAGSLLLALPGVVQRLDMLRPGQDVFHMGTFEGGGTQLYIFTAVQHISFLLGVLFFAVFIAFEIGGWQIGCLFIAVGGLIYTILAKYFKVRFPSHFAAIASEQDYS